MNAFPRLIQFASHTVLGFMMNLFERQQSISIIIFLKQLFLIPSHKCISSSLNVNYNKYYNTKQFFLVRQWFSIMMCKSDSRKPENIQKQLKLDIVIFSSIFSL